MSQATARANSNIAFIKYWGNSNESLRLPVNPSLSMNLDGLLTQTTVRWGIDSASDQLMLNGIATTGQALDRVSSHLDRIRQRLHVDHRAEVHTENNFPMGAGIASSASAFAALTVAAVAAAGAELSERELTTLARLGSGSASRSVPDGFVEWHVGNGHETSYAESIAPHHHWQLVDVIAVISDAHKAVGSTRGHASAGTSDLQMARVRGAAERLRIVKDAVLQQDFAAFAPIVEEDSNLMHAVMMTSRPPLFYWMPMSLTVMDAVRSWRAEGLSVCYTLDAGPNVHCLCLASDVEEVQRRLEALGVARVLTAKTGAGAEVVSLDPPIG